MRQKHGDFNVADITNYLLDMDGTIYLGDHLIEGSALLVENIRRKGGHVIFLTNNSSNEPIGYAKKLQSFGLDVNEEDIFTSGDATIQTILAIAKNKTPKVFLLGTSALHQQFERAEIEIVNDSKEEPDYVILGFDKTLTYEKIEAAHKHIVNGVPFYATHPDLVCPMKNGYIPDTGSMIKMFEASTGVKPTIVGKPESLMAKAVAGKYGLDISTAAMVGDRLTTDIAFANNAGACAILVLSGETNMEMYNNQKEVKANFIFDSVYELALAMEVGDMT